jgi:hypothetical protein
VSAHTALALPAPEGDGGIGESKGRSRGAVRKGRPNE